MATFKWHGDEFLKRTKDELDKRLQTAGAAVQSRVVESLSTSGRGAAASAKWGRGPIRSKEKMRVGKKKSVYIFRSKPGEPPHAQTGLLMKSIFWQLTGRGSVIIGTPLKYGRALELGYEKNNLLPRPYLVPGLNWSLSRVQAIMTRPFPFG